MNGTVVGNDTIRNSMCISTDPAEHARFAGRFIDLGFDRLYVHSAGPDQHAFIESYGREVIPLIREQEPPVAPASRMA